MYMNDYDYEGDHSMSFWPVRYDENGKRIRIEASEKVNTWDDFELIPLNRPYVALPSANYAMVQIPGTSTRLDLTPNIPGGKTYGSRSGSWSFAAPVTENRKSWTVRYNELAEYFDGSRFVVRLEDDPGTYYEGRVTVSGYEPGAAYSIVTFNYDIDPESRNTLRLTG